MIWCDDLVCDVFNEISIDTLHVFLISFDSITISHVKMRKLAILLIYKTKYLNNDRNKKMIENIQPCAHRSCLHKNPFELISHLKM